MDARPHSSCLVRSNEWVIKLGHLDRKCIVLRGVKAHAIDTVWCIASVIYLLSEYDYLSLLAQINLRPCELLSGIFSMAKENLRVGMF